MDWPLPRQSRRTRQALTLLGGLALAAAGTGILTAPAAHATTGITYYISTGGSDSNSGTSSSSPWRSLAKVNATTFQPGDRILFQTGGTWTGQLWPKGSGTSGSPITVGDYGSGAKPSIAGAGTVPEAVKLWNQQYWTIKELDVSNDAGTAAANLGDFRGIHIGGDNSQTLSGFTIDSDNVHDVTGVDDWVGGSASNDKPGINYGMGWDRAKDTGGIVFNTSVPNIASPPSTPTILDSILVENTSIENTSWGGIVLKQYSGDAPGAVATGWGLRTTATDPKYSPFTNVTIQGNYITQKGTAYGSNGMLIDDVRGGLVQDNFVDRVGTSGIEFDYSDQVIAQHNEATGTTVKAGGSDSNGLDTDMGNTNAVAQYNYLHNNGMAYLACACNHNISFGSATFRYNVLANDTNTEILLANTSGSLTSVYNNTVYDTAAALMVNGSGPTKLTNNIFYTTVAGASMSTASGVSYNNNLYGGTSPTVPTGDAHAITGDPQFANPTAGGTGTQAGGPDLSAGSNWQIAATSPAADAGLTVANNGGLDYAGATVPIVPDMGALQHNPPSNPIFGDNFDALPLGALASATDGWTVTSTGNQVNVVATPSSTDKSAELVRTQNTGGTPGTNITRTFTSPLTGTVTVEADVMRNDSTGGYFCLPYLYNASGALTVSVAFSHGEIEAYNGTTLQSIEPYTNGSWYHVKLVVDTAQQHFDLFVDGRRVLTAAPFRNSAPSIGSMAFYANGGEYGSAYVNNVSVY